MGLGLASSRPAPPCHTAFRGARRGVMAAVLLDLAHWSTWVVCAVIKLPQLAAVLAAGSARGLSLGSLVLELAG